MTKDELKTAAWHWSNGHMSETDFFDAVEQYCKSLHDGKPLVSGSLPPKQQFISELKLMCEKFDQIDKQVAWQEVEPNWWLEIMSMYRQAQSVIQKYGGNDR